MLHDFNDFIFEITLSRVYQHMENHDTALITAYRSELINCVNDSPMLSLLNNHQKNKVLKEYLKKEKGYGVTDADGHCIENFGTDLEKIVREHTLFVVNLNDDPNFWLEIIELGKIYCQDFVLLKERGRTALIYGTNYGPFPGLDKILEAGTFRPGKMGPFFTRIGKNRRPFAFESTRVYEKLENIARSILITS